MVDKGLWKSIQNSFTNEVNLRHGITQAQLSLEESTYFGQSFSTSSNENLTNKWNNYYDGSDDDRKNDENSISSRSQVKDEESYYDISFYQLLLKDFLERTKNKDIISGKNAGKKHETQNDFSEGLEAALALRRNKKRRKNVDRKASKGRKIRYVEHPKLVNFMFPVPMRPSRIDIDRLMNSLFQ